MKFLTSLLILLFALPAFALDGDNCPSEQILLGRWAINRQFTVADGCLVQVTPREKPGMVYREYVFDQSGRVMIFNSLDGPFETATAQRNYYLLPVIDVPQMRRVGDAVEVTSASGAKFWFTADQAVVTKVSEGLEISEDPTVDLAPGGHFEIVRFNGVILDLGWRLGDRASRDPQSVSTSRVGATNCQVKNQEMSAYKDPFTGVDYYQAVFLFSESERLSQFLNQRCGLPALY